MTAKPYIIEEYVRWSDVDFAGIIFYGSYVRFFEIAETELFRACGLAYARVFDRYNIFLPRKAVHSEFYLPARLDDRLRVATYVGRVGTKSMTLNFDVLRDEVERSEEHTSELQSLAYLVCRLLLEKKKRRRSESILGTD